MQRGCAPDSLGWTSEALQQIAVQAELRSLPGFLCGLYLGRSAGPVVEDLFNSSRLIPLWKDPAGQGLRPIAIPTAWRKLAAMLIQRRWQTTLRTACGPFQFAAGSPDGTSRFASAIQVAMQDTPADHLVLRTDVTNAFGSAHRHCLLHLLHDLHPDLAAAYLPWLSRPTLGIAYDEADQLHVLPAMRGIPQGDPLSSLSFCLLLARPLAELAERDGHAFLALGYADDVLIRAPVHSAAQALRQWTDLLAPLGLSVNATKTAVWSPGGTVPDNLVLLTGQRHASTDGITVCGLPVQTDSEPASHDLPVGNPAFVQAFLEAKTRLFQFKLATLMHVLDTMGTNSVALHIVTHLLRVGVQSSFVHLFRFLPPVLSTPWAASLDTLVVTHLSRLLNLPLHLEIPLHILRAPFSQGGLQFCCLETEASLHFLSGALALHDAQIPDRPLRMAASHLDDCARRLQTLTGIDVEAEIRDHPPRACSKRLRLALAASLGTRLRRLAPWLEPPGWHTNPPPNPWRIHNLFLTSWMVPRPRLMLYAGPLRLAFALHCGLPLYGPGSHCSYTPASTGHPCGCLLGRASHHVMTCAYAPRMQRHNHLRDAWATLIKQAGWTVRVEQLVPTSQDHKRADIVATGPSGEGLALDVMVTAPVAHDTAIGPHLYQQARAKASRYHVLPASSLPDGTQFLPLIHGAVVPFLEHHAMELFHRLARQAGQRRDPTAPAYWQPSLHAWSCAAAASFTIPAARAAFRLHATCGQLLFM